MVKSATSKAQHLRVMNVFAAPAMCIIHQSLSQQLALSPAKNAALLRPFVTAWLRWSVPVMGFNFRLSGSTPHADWNHDLSVVGCLRLPLYSELDV